MSKKDTKLYYLISMDATEPLTKEQIEKIRIRIAWKITCEERAIGLVADSEAEILNIKVSNWDEK